MDKRSAGNGVGGWGVEVVNVTKQFGEFKAVDNVHLQIRDG